MDHMKKIKIILSLLVCVSVGATGSFSIQAQEDNIDECLKTVPTVEVAQTKTVGLLRESSPVEFQNDIAPVNETKVEISD